MTGIGASQILLPPPTRFTRWRLRSRSCAAVDAIAVVAGAGLYLLTAIDSVASWPSNRVLVSDPELSRIAGVLLLPFWPWLMISSVMVFGLGRRRARSRPLPRPSRRVLAAFVPAAVAGAAVIAGGIAVGAAKGAVRVLPGPRYQVSTIDVNRAWTTIPVARFHLWQARFVREDSFFLLFGLLLAAGCVHLLMLHRKAIQPDQRLT